jgi:hypothetical protein
MLSIASVSLQLLTTVTVCGAEQMQLKKGGSNEQLKRNHAGSNVASVFESKQVRDAEPSTSPPFPAEEALTVTGPPRAPLVACPEVGSIVAIPGSEVVQWADIFSRVRGT